MHTGDPSNTDVTIDTCFTSASKEGCWITSCKNSDYNCIAWAAGDTQNWWWPSSNAIGTYWPPGIPCECTLSAFVSAFGSAGYDEWSQENGGHEAGYEKIAIYADDQGVPTHAARQLPNGRWASKLGPYKDVQHATTAAFEGQSNTAYGRVVKYLRRKEQPPPTPPINGDCAMTCTSICGNSSCPPSRNP